MVYLSADRRRGAVVKIYTKAGDRGFTELGTGDPVHKSDGRVESYGTIDELSSFVGLAISHLSQEEDLVEELIWVQRKLFQIGTLLAFPGQDAPLGSALVEAEDVSRLETAIDRFEYALPALTAFILPGGIKGAAFLHCARSICRRAERLCAALDLADYPLGGYIVPFLNRLSDYLFCAARWINLGAGQNELLAN